MTIHVPGKNPFIKGTSSYNKFEEAKHPRDAHGKFAEKPGVALKKVPPKSFKFYKQGYKPKAKNTITGTNVTHYAKQLYEAKKSGQFESDYEYWLHAQKLANEAKKKHGANAPKPHGIVNMAFHHEIADTGSLNMLDANVTAPKPPAQQKNVHGTTPSGIKTVSKFLAPGQLSWTGETLGGVNGARVYEDNKGVKWIVKVPGGWKGTSKAYSNNDFLSDLDVATSRIQNKAGLPVPSMHTMKLPDGRTASVQKMYSRAKEPFANGQGIDLDKLSDEEIVEIQKNMVLDWLLSNHDAHSANFLETDKGIIGIDKGQSFKYFGKDKLTPQFGSDLNPPLAPNKPVYSTLMSQYVGNKGVLFDWNKQPELQKTIQRLQNIDDDEYRDLLRPYAEKAAVLGLINYPGKHYEAEANDHVKKFLDAAVYRKNTLAHDFGNLWKELHHDEEDTADASPINQYNAGDISFGELKDHVANNPPADSNWPAVLYDWYGNGDITWKQHNELKAVAFGSGKPKTLEELTPKGMGKENPDVTSFKEAWAAGNYESMNDFLGDVFDTYSSGELTNAEVEELKSFANEPANWPSNVSKPKKPLYGKVRKKPAQLITNGVGDKGIVVDIDGNDHTFTIVDKKSEDVLTVKLPNVESFDIMWTGDKWQSIDEDGNINFDDPDEYKLDPPEPQEEWEQQLLGSPAPQQDKPKKYIGDWKVGDQFNYEGNNYTVTEVEPGYNLTAKGGFGSTTFYPEDLSSMKPGLSGYTKPSTKFANAKAATPKAVAGVPKGYAVVEHPTEAGKFAIQKPGGGFSQSKDGVTKAWATKDEAIKSSTMKKYAEQAANTYNYEKNSAISVAKAAPDVSFPPPAGLNQPEYEAIKAKIAAGEDYTPDEYLKLKSGISLLNNAKKAAGAAQVEHDWEDAPASAPAATPKAKGFKEKPKFKTQGGAPPAVSKATGPNAKKDGAALWEMKKSGQIADDYKMWSEAKKLANKGKKEALLKNPNAQSGVDYSSANQIRNVAMRLEFDETGDVKWETAQEKTSEEVGQTVGQMKKTIAAHAHKPMLAEQGGHTVAAHTTGHFPDQYDSSAPAGSYKNPHAFSYKNTNDAANYGYQYTDHKKGWGAGQKEAWYAFTGSTSGVINTYFRTGEVGAYGNPEQTKKYAQGIVAAFKSDNVKPLEDWTQVVRGTDGGWELGIGADVVTFDQMKAMEGKVVRNKCPVSASLRDKPPWGAYRITYKLPPGFRGLGLYGKSSHPGETEMLLPPGMAYRIVEVKEGKGGGFKHEVLVEVVDVKLPEVT